MHNKKDRDLQETVFLQYISDLTHLDVKKRQWAVERIGSSIAQYDNLSSFLRENKGIPALVKLLSDPDCSVRFYAVSTLCRAVSKNTVNQKLLYDTNVIDTLQSMADTDESENIRKMAVITIKAVNKYTPSVESSVPSQSYTTAFFQNSSSMDVNTALEQCRQERAEQYNKQQEQIAAEHYITKQEKKLEYARLYQPEKVSHYESKVKGYQRDYDTEYDRRDECVMS